MKYFLDEIGTKYIAQKIQDVVRVMPCDGLDEVSDGQVACVPVTGYQDEYLTLSALEDGTITITIPEIIDSTYATSLSYSKDKSSWVETVVDDTDQTISIPISSYEDVYLKGKAKQWCYATKNNMGVLRLYPLGIKSSTNIIVHGNIMSLLYEDDFKDKTTFPRGSKSTFGKLFMNNTHLINAENLILPATKLTEYCYCDMFQNCTALTTAPELPATTLVNYCYQAMFIGCSSLNSITMLATDISASSCLEDWVLDVASTGTFTKAASMTSLPTGDSGIPSGWVVVNK